MGQERGKGIEIRSQWADVFCELRSGRGAVVLLRTQRIRDAENPRVNGRDAIRLVYHAARRAGERSGELKHVQVQDCLLVIEVFE